jgi:hypothetical protein
MLPKDEDAALSPHAHMPNHSANELEIIDRSGTRASWLLKLGNMEPFGSLTASAITKTVNFKQCKTIGLNDCLSVLLGTGLRPKALVVSIHGHVELASKPSWTANGRGE